MKYKKSIFSFVLLLFICLSSSEINAQKGSLEAHLVLSPLGSTVKGNKFSSSGDNFMTIRNFEKNTYEIGGGIRYYHKKNFGYEFRIALKNYQFSYALDSPVRQVSVIPPRYFLPLYTSLIDINLNLIGAELGIFYKYRTLTAKFDIEFNHPYQIKGNGPKRLFYDRNSSPIVTTLVSDGVLPGINVIETFSVADQIYAYLIPKFTLEYKLNKHLDLYGSCKFKWYDQTPFHTFDSSYRDEDNIYQSQVIEVYENFLSFHIGMRYNLKLGRRD